jgi:hypothetical protein
VEPRCRARRRGRHHELTSPLARGLFHRAIGERGTVIIRTELTPSRAAKEQAGAAYPPHGDANA